MNLTELVNRPFELAARRATRRAKSLVEIGPEAERGLWRRDVARLALGIAALISIFWLPDWVEIIACPALGFIVGGVARMSTTEAQAYKYGWLDGRRRIYETALRHHDCQHEAADWLEIEAAHDAVNVSGAVRIAVDDGEQR